MRLYLPTFYNSLYFLAFPFAFSIGYFDSFLSILLFTISSTLSPNYPAYSDNTQLRLPVLLSHVPNHMTIIRNGAAARSTPLVKLKQKKSIEQPRNRFLYFQRTFTKRIIRQAVAPITLASQTVGELHALMNETASKLPEYLVVMAMSVGSSLEPQLMAEIGDVTRFTHKGAITRFKRLLSERGTSFQTWLTSAAQAPVSSHGCPDQNTKSDDAVY